MATDHSEETELRAELHQTLDNISALIAKLPKNSLADSLAAELSQLRRILVRWRQVNRNLQA